MWEKTTSNVQNKVEWKFLCATSKEKLKEFFHKLEISRGFSLLRWGKWLVIISVFFTSLNCFFCFRRGGWDHIRQSCLTFFPIGLQQLAFAAHVIATLLPKGKVHAHLRLYLSFYLWSPKHANKIWKCNTWHTLAINLKLI